MSLHRKQCQRPIAIACKCFVHMIKNKMIISTQSIMRSFTYGLWCSCSKILYRFIFQQIFLCEISMTLCLVYKTTCSDQFSDMIWGAIKNKLSTCLWHWDPSDILTKMRMSYLNQTCQSECSFTLFVLLTDSSVWTPKANAHLYTVSSVDKIAAVIVIYICFCCDKHSV